MAPLEVASQSMMLKLDLPSGCWELRSGRGRELHVAGARFGLEGAAEGRPFVWDGSLAEAEAEHLRETTSPAGPAHGCRLRLVPPGLPLEIEIDLLLPLQEPMLLLRLKANNGSGEDVQLHRIDLLRATSDVRGTGESRERGIRLEGAAPTAFHLNGWQSWSYCGTLRAVDRQPRSRLGPLMRARHEIPGVRLSGGRGEFVSDLYGVLVHPRRRAGLLAGFVSQREMFGRVHACLRSDSASLALVCPADGVVLAPGSSLSTDWACLQTVDLDVPRGLDPYLKAAARVNNARLHQESPTGWCSWYQFFAGVERDRLTENTTWIAENRQRLPLDVILLDDGFEATVGDWDHPRPGSGLDLGQLSRQMEAAGGMPGLWLAPLVAAHGSRLARNHPGWILRRPGGRPVGIGYTWGLRTRALDLSHPEARGFVRETIETAVKSWGFRYLKLDFLYAGAMIGERHDRACTRAQAYGRTMREIREAAGEDTFLLGCGGPLGPAIGIFDGMRIGPDVAIGWHPSYPRIPLLPKGDPEFPAVRNALRNAMNRSHLHRRWWVNDGDCVLLRPAGKEGTPPSRGVASRLSEAEAQTLLTVTAMLGGSLFVSDHLPSLPESRLAWLSRLLPPLPGGGAVLGWESTDYPTTIVLPLRGAAGQWTLVAVINWGDHPVDRGLEWGDLGLGELPAGRHCVDFWRATYIGTHKERLDLGRIAAHGVAWVAVRPSLPRPAWLGDTLHASQGLVVEHWEEDDGGFNALLAPTHPTRGLAWIAFPQPEPHFKLDGASVPARRVAPGVYCLELGVSRRSELTGLHR